jgi:hypothetical protein
VLKETDAQIEIAAIAEDCPNCGAALASSLKRRPKVSASPGLPKLQTAYDLTRFKIDIEKLSQVVPLSSTGSLCIVGQNANLLITRLCVRALLPAAHDGLDSPNVLVIDAGNRSDFYLAVNFARQYGLDLRNALDRIIVSRTFTIYQLKSMLQKEAPRVIPKYQARVVVIPGLLDLFEDPNIKKKDAKRVIERMMHAINEISRRLLVIVSVQKSNYASMVLPRFTKRIELNSAERGRLNADVYNGTENASVMLTERELKITGR